MSDTVKMTVTDGWAVYVDGEQHGGGSVVEVDTATASRWAERGWARPVEDKQVASRTPPPARARRAAP